ncbi:MAG TPA: hypothetical protein PLD15_06205 [Mesotoga sp.]|nr:hypothetical protein [Mesotoga sp.]
MNVNEFIPTIKASDYGLDDLIDFRESDFLGFCARESQNGGIDPTVPLYMPKGQENVRVLFARTVEEILESLDASDEIHRQEELIDAWNFALSMLFLNTGTPAPRIKDYLIVAVEKYRRDGVPSKDVVAGIKPFTELLDKLRNRSWQNNSQHPVFNGTPQLVRALAKFHLWVEGQFETPDDFTVMNVAKHKVLEFRLQTNY